MTGPATPGQEGPSYAPPPLPEGWIAQWDGMSRKYYFVQLSTGASQWETPTHPAPTGPTPQATPQGIEHPYGTPGQQSDMGGEIVNNADGSRSIRFPDGRVEPLGADGERGFSSFAMQQLLGGKKQSQGGLGNLGGLASQFLGSGSTHNTQSSGGGSATSGIVGALAGQLLGGGKKQNQQQSYTGSQNTQQQSQGGLMGSLGGMFGGHSGAGSGSQGGSFGYSQHSSQQGGYTGSAPPTSYQPSGTGSSSYNPPPPPQQHHYTAPNNPPSQSYGNPQPSYGQSPNQAQPPYGSPSNQQQPQYGAPSSQPPYGGAPSNPQSSYGPASSQQPYGGTPSNQPSSYGGQPPSHAQQPPYSSGQQPPYSPPYGGIQHQPSYGSGHPPPQSQQYQPPPSYDQGGSGGYGASPNPQPGHYAEMSGGLYGNPAGPGAPNVPMGSHPHHGQQAQQPPGPLPGQYGAPPGGYGGQQGRW